MRTDLDHVQLRAPADPSAVSTAERTLGRALPRPILDLYRDSDGLTTDHGILVYGAGELVERNRTLEVALYAPGYLAVGDDGGGRALLLSPSEDGCWVDMGSMDPRIGTPLGMTFATWLDAGLPLPEDEAPAATVDLYLERVPAGGLKAMLRLKKHLGLTVSTAGLKELLGRVPVRLHEDVDPGLAERLCRDFNAVDPCLGVRTRGGADGRV